MESAVGEIDRTHNCIWQAQVQAPVSVTSAPVSVTSAQTNFGLLLKSLCVRLKVLLMFRFQCCNHQVAHFRDSILQTRADTIHKAVKGHIQFPLDLSGENGEGQKK